MTVGHDHVAVSLVDIARRGPVLAVVAHPDDESFGLGALLAGFVTAGTEVRVVCLTHGEASSLGAADDLGQVRQRELTAAAERLGIVEVALHDFPDGGLERVEAAVVDGVVEAACGDAATLVVFEPGGVTGHPDHRAATASAHRVADRRGLPVVEWGVAPAVASALNAELGTTFVGLDGASVADVVVDRSVQRAAIACHHTQALDNAVLRRRLELEGPTERVRLRPPAIAPGAFRRGSTGASRTSRSTTDHQGARHGDPHHRDEVPR